MKIKRTPGVQFFLSSHKYGHIALQKHTRTCLRWDYNCGARAVRCQSNRQNNIWCKTTNRTPGAQFCVYVFIHMKKLFCQLQARNSILGIIFLNIGTPIPVFAEITVTGWLAVKSTNRTKFWRKKTKRTPGVHFFCGCIINMDICRYKNTHPYLSSLRIVSLRSTGSLLLTQSAKQQFVQFITIKRIPEQLNVILRKYTRVFGLWVGWARIRWYRSFFIFPYIYAS